MRLQCNNTLQKYCSCVYSKFNAQRYVLFQCSYFFRRTRSRMESYYVIKLIFIFAVNVFFFFSGICLNSLVILSFWRSVQLRKKLCYFMIMVLSCCDLLSVLTNNPLMTLITMSWLTGKLDGNARWAHVSMAFHILLFW